MTLEAFLQQLRSDPQSITFDDTMAVIADNYDYTPTAFRNGNQENAAGTNEGSCKILAFGLLQQLTLEQTLQCFGDYYRIDVLQNPGTDSHQNIRQFLINGWDGVKFEGAVLSAKKLATAS